MQQMTDAQAAAIRPARQLAADLFEETQVSFIRDDCWKLVTDDGEIFRGSPDEVMAELQRLHAEERP